MTHKSNKEIWESILSKVTDEEKQFLLELKDDKTDDKVTITYYKEDFVNYYEDYNGFNENKDWEDFKQYCLKYREIAGYMEEWYAEKSTWKIRYANLIKK
jgi:hypothetical protein